MFISPTKSSPLWSLILNPAFSPIAVLRPYSQLENTSKPFHISKKSSSRSIYNASKIWGQIKHYCKPRRLLLCIQWCSYAVRRSSSIETFYLFKSNSIINPLNVHKNRTKIAKL
jgi:hypothetical protein